MNRERPADRTSLRVELFVANVARSVAFYRDVLGFLGSAGDATGDEGRYRVVHRGAVILGLCAAETLPADHPAARRPDRPPGSGVELVIEVDDVEDELARVRASGVLVASELADQPWGLRDFRLVDPDGYYLRVTSR